LGSATLAGIVAFAFSLLSGAGTRSWSDSGGLAAGLALADMEGVEAWAADWVVVDTGEVVALVASSVVAEAVLEGAEPRVVGKL
jgi:hypothetical protein